MDRGTDVITFLNFDKLTLCPVVSWIEGRRVLRPICEDKKKKKHNTTQHIRTNVLNTTGQEPHTHQTEKDKAYYRVRVRVKVRVRIGVTVRV